MLSIETSRLVLTTLQKDAAEMTLKFYSDNRDSFEPWEPSRPHNFYTLSYQKANLHAEEVQMNEGKLLRYWIFHKDHSNEIIGTVSFQNFLLGPFHSCTVGYKFAEKFQHQGYAYESLNKAIEVLQERNLFHRIEAYIMPNNLPSLRLIHKLYFVLEGVSYSYAKINGKWEDHMRFSYILSDL